MTAEPSASTPLSEVPEGWWLSVRCRCKTVEYHANFRRRHFPPETTAAELVAHLRCRRCGERPHEVAWEAWRDGQSRIHEEKRRVLCWTRQAAVGPPGA